MDELIELIQAKVWKDLKKDRKTIAAVDGDLDAIEVLVDSAVERAVKAAVAPALDLA